MEWYDFFLAATAALQIWPTIFFSGLSPILAIAVSYSSFFIAYLTRPIGSIIFGHLGDKVGRKSTMIWTLLIAGICTLGIAVLPPYAEIGLLAPLSVIILRIAYGIGIGGEFGGASSWIAEFAAKSKRRAFWASFGMVVIPLGVTCSSAAFIVAQATLRPAEVVTWGWRVLFGLGALMLLVALVIRYFTFESPIFADLKQKRAVERSPAIQVMKENWRSILLLAGVILGPIYVGNVESYPFVLGYWGALKISPIFSNITIVIGYIFASVMVLVGAVLGDKFGRKVVLRFGILWGLVMAVVFYPLINLMNPVGIVLAEALIIGSTQFTLSVFPVVSAEYFSTSRRFSGSGISFQTGAFMNGMIAVFLVPVVVSFSGGVLGAWPYLAAGGVICTILSLTFLTRLRETRDIDITSVQAKS
jgi:MFS family permease